MLSFDAGLPSSGFCEPPPDPWTSLSPAEALRPDRGFAALSHTGLATRFLSWEGHSGKSYVFTVYAASGCPAFCDAVLIAAACDEAGRRQVLAVLDTGPFPEPTLARAEQDLGGFAGSLEFHIHLLARSPQERRAAIADLAGKLMRGSAADGESRL